jgi:Na+/H+ antiporter NhaC
MRYFFDRDGNYAGSSMQGWEILLLLLFPVALIIFLVFYPFYFLYKYDSREKDRKYEEEHPEILKVDSYITCWYPWHRNKVPYILTLIFWFIGLLLGLI